MPEPRLPTTPAPDRPASPSLLEQSEEQFQVMLRRWIVLGGIGFALLLMFGIYGYSLLLWRWPPILGDHFITLVLLPIAAVVAFLVVYALRSAEGPLELEAFTVKFKGASAPLILWLLVFLAFVWAIKYTW